MSLLTFAKTALGSMVKQPVTVCYPQENLVAPERLRGHIVNDMDVCICCGMCARRCPAGALAVDRKAVPGRSIRMPAWYAASVSKAVPNTA